MNYKKYIVVTNLIVVLVYFGMTVFNKETILKEGELVLLELAPVDPRSLMQGDYMKLSYKIVQSSYIDDITANNDTVRVSSVLDPNSENSISKRGYLVIQLDENGVGKGVRFFSKNEPLKEGELLVKYFKPDWRLNIGAESYFFQEGDREKFEKAKYGGLRIDKEGNSILIGLYDGDRKLIY
ncbi:GDYXXLXY domain-containing protein [Myroides guanonis]|uniref:Uncharacterized membrane-anchored protein n=1 Tax=Myroides guanonis TaxID=1150112 RepID=A0A1I3LH70_9FLAO|nr:GDYXXLXY domain-containing protein [Myroides guanonis]SFI83806.1 Uncharacterized membrane-anchored protein [Myroides guanonis]